jgi:hypothetical protein
LGVQSGEARRLALFGVKAVVLHDLLRRLGATAAIAALGAVRIDPPPTNVVSYFGLRRLPFNGAPGRHTVVLLLAARCGSSKPSPALITFSDSVL